MEPLLTGNRNAVLYHNRFLRARDSASLTKIAHPGELIRAVKEELGLDAAQWRWFLKLNNYWHGRNPAERKHEIHLMTRMAIEIARPDADRSLHEEVAAQTVSRYRRHGELLEQEHAWRAWVHLARECIDNTDGLWELMPVADAMFERLQNGGNWTPTTWENYRRRSEEWHQQWVPQELAWEPTPPRSLTWESALGETEMDGLTLRPLTTSSALREAGSKLHNCLSTYDGSCASGHSRIFGVYREEKLIAAGELTEAGAGGWRVNQVSEKANRRARPEVARAMARAAELYGRAVLNGSAARTRVGAITAAP